MRLPCPNIECVFFANTHGTFAKMTHLLACKNAEIIGVTVSDHSAITLQISNRKSPQNQHP